MTKTYLLIYVMNIYHYIPSISSTTFFLKLKLETEVFVRDPGTTTGGAPDGLFSTHLLHEGSTYEAGYSCG